MKRKRIEPVHFKNYYSYTSVNDQIEHSTTSNVTLEQYWRRNSYYQLLDVVIFNLKRRFSEESLDLAKSVDSFLKLDYSNSSTFINYYKVNVNQHISFTYL